MGGGDGGQGRDLGHPDVKEVRVGLAGCGAGPDCRVSVVAGAGDSGP